jgi:hypothetical protein
MNKNVIAWLMRNCESTYNFEDEMIVCVYHGYNLRYQNSVLQVGNKGFDRWANSVAYETELSGRNISREVNIALIEAGKDQRGPWERSLEIMSKMRVETMK